VPSILRITCLVTGGVGGQRADVEAEQLGDIPLGMGDACVSFFLFVYSLYVHCTFGRFAAIPCFVNKYWHIRQ
jgi:hypothetical protein